MDDAPVEQKATPAKQTAPEKRDPSALTRWLQTRLGVPFDIVFTENRYSLLSFKMLRDRVLLRSHIIFHKAPQDVREAIARFVMGDKQASGLVLSAYVKEHQETIHKKARAGARHLRRRSGRRVSAFIWGTSGMI